MFKSSYKSIDPPSVNYYLRMKVLASLALLLLLVNCYDFNDYIVEFGRLYSTQEEYDFRKKIF